MNKKITVLILLLLLVGCSCGSDSIYEKDIEEATIKCEHIGGLVNISLKNAWKENYHRVVNHTLEAKCGDGSAITFTIKHG